MLNADYFSDEIVLLSVKLWSIRMLTKFASYWDRLNDIRFFKFYILHLDVYYPLPILCLSMYLQVR